jgi:hypothetical protein
MEIRIRTAIVAFLLMIALPAVGQNFHTSFCHDMKMMCDIKLDAAKFAYKAALIDGRLRKSEQKYLQTKINDFVEEANDLHIYIRDASVQSSMTPGTISAVTAIAGLIINTLSGRTKKVKDRLGKMYDQIDYIVLNDINN